MRIELAPMEGITTYTYRNALEKYYGGIDTYFTPYISTHKTKDLNYKEIADINPDNNKGITLVPQVLTADADEFFHTATQITAFGYDHINLNFGCPSGTVTPKGKGAGALIYPEKLERLLDEIFEKTDLKISVKTRMGFVEYEEWERLLEVYIKFPLEELVVHARVREDFYKGRANIDYFKESLDRLDENSEIKELSFNGDIFTIENYQSVLNALSFNKDMPPHEGLHNSTSELSIVSAVMIGRGIIANPALAAQIKSSGNFDSSDEYIDSAGESSIKNATDLFDLKKFKEFNLELANNYQEVMSGDKNALFKLKELWVYMAKTIERAELLSQGKNGYVFDFTKSPETSVAKKLVKSIRKCNSIKEYESIIRMISL